MTMTCLEYKNQQIDEMEKTYPRVAFDVRVCMTTQKPLIAMSPNDILV